MRRRERRQAASPSGDLVRELVEAPADKGLVALTFVDSLGVIERLTFAQLSVGVGRWANLLHAGGIGPGDRVAVLLGASPEWFEVALGAVKAGAVVVPAHDTLDAQGVEAFLQEADPTLVVAGPRSERAARRVAGDRVLGIGDAARLLPGQRPVANVHDARPEDLVFILPGTPWGATHTYASALAASKQAGDWLDVREGDRVWCSEPPESAPGLWTALGTWSRGAELVFREGEFDARATLGLIVRLGVTLLCQPAEELEAMAELKEATLHDLSLIRRVVSAGLEEVAAREAFRRVFGLYVVGGLVSPETGPVTADGPAAGPLTPLEGVVLGLVDQDGRIVPEDAEGLLAVGRETSSLFAGYWNAPEQTSARYRGNWFLTGVRAAGGASRAVRLVSEVADSPLAREPVAEQQSDALTPDVTLASRIAPYVRGPQTAKAPQDLESADDKRRPA